MTMMLMIMRFVSAPTCYLPYRSEGDELLSGGEPINKVPSQHRAGQPAGSVVITQFFFSLFTDSGPLNRLNPSIHIFTWSIGRHNPVQNQEF